MRGHFAVLSAALTDRARCRRNANMAVARVLLQGVVPAFLRRHAQMHLDLAIEDRLVDIVTEGFEAGVRLQESVPQDMIAVRFGGDSRFVTVASPGYLKKYGVPRSPHELKQHACIRYRTKGGRIFRWEFERNGRARNVDVAGPLTLNDDQLMVAAATQR